MNPVLVALAAVAALGLGVVGCALLWQVEHPNTKFHPWLRCISGDGHLPGSRGYTGGHRCARCNEPLSMEEIANVLEDRVKLSRDGHHIETTRDSYRAH